jgi:hypothetical protein
MFIARVVAERKAEHATRANLPLEATASYRE